MVKHGKATRVQICSNHGGVLCSLWFWCHGDCLGFSFGASIPVVLYGVAYFLLGAFQTFLLYGTSAVVRPCTAVDSVVSLLKAYIYGSPLATPLKKWLLRLTSLHPTLPFVEHIVQWRTEPCLGVHWCHEGHVLQH